MASRDSLALPLGPASAAPTVRARAVPGARWAGKTTRRHVLARLWEVHETRVSHRLRDGDNCVADFLAIVRHPDIDPAPYVAAVLEAVEDRYMDEARSDRPKLEKRLRYLMEEAEHRAQAEQDRALMVGKGVNEACRNHMAVLAEIVVIRTALGLEEE